MYQTRVSVVTVPAPDKTQLKTFFVQNFADKVSRYRFVDRSRCILSLTAAVNRNYLGDGLQFRVRGKIPVCRDRPACLMMREGQSGFAP